MSSQLMISTGKKAIIRIAETVMAVVEIEKEKEMEAETETEKETEATISSSIISNSRSIMTATVMVVETHSLINPLSECQFLTRVTAINTLPTTKNSNIIQCQLQ